MAIFLINTFRIKFYFYNIDCTLGSVCRNTEIQSRDMWRYFATAHFTLDLCVSSVRCHHSKQLVLWLTLENIL